MTTLVARPLTREAFQPYGEVIELDGARHYPINDGLTTRFHDLCRVDVDAGQGRPLVNVFRSEPLPLPHRVRVMERHPLGSQAFVPLDDLPFLVLVAGDTDRPTAGDLRLFISNGEQGVNIGRNTWHHFQIVLGRRRDFLVIDRGGPGENLEEVSIEDEAWIPAQAVG